MDTIINRHLIEQNNKKEIILKKIGRKLKQEVGGQVSGLISLSVKLQLTKESYDWLVRESPDIGKGPLASKSVEFYSDYCNNRKGFFLRLIELDFELIKSILRKVGRHRAKNPYE